MGSKDHRGARKDRNKTLSTRSIVEKDASVIAVAEMRKTMAPKFKFLQAITWVSQSHRHYIC